MWWDLEWHVWLGLILSAGGFWVGVAAWNQARRAKKTAGRVETGLGDFKSELQQQLENAEHLRSTPPAVAEPASMVPLRLDDGTQHLGNNGKGSAYNVRIEPANVFTNILGDDRWGTIKPGESEKVILTSQFDSENPAVWVYWEENASGVVESREVVFPSGGRRTPKPPWRG